MANTEGSINRAPVETERQPPARGDITVRTFE